MPQLTGASHGCNSSGVRGEARLFRAFQDRWRKIRAAVGLDGQGNLFAFNDTIADELGGGAVHLCCDKERQLVALYFTLIQGQWRAIVVSHGAVELLTILLQGKSERNRTITGLQGARPVARNVRGQEPSGKHQAKYGYGE